MRRRVLKLRYSVRKDERMKERERERVGERETHTDTKACGCVK